MCNIDTILGSIGVVYTIDRVYVIIKGEKLHLVSKTFRISIPILNFEMKSW